MTVWRLRWDLLILCWRISVYLPCRSTIRTAGFSYKTEGPLDLRLNPEKGITAAERLQTIEEEELRGCFWKMRTNHMQKRSPELWSRKSEGQSHRYHDAPSPGY